MITPSASAKASGVMIGYLGLRDDPACIFVSTSSERVSWLGMRFQRHAVERPPKTIMRERTVVEAEGRAMGRDEQDIRPDFGASGFGPFNDLFSELTDVAISRVEDDGNDGLGPGSPSAGAGTCTKKLSLHCGVSDMLGRD